MSGRDHFETTQRSRCLIRVVALLAAMIAPSNAIAGIMDWIRSYDLNNYALGVAVAPSQSPYLDDDSNLIVYPYLTSFRHSVFHDDWLIVRDGDLGARWVNDTGWEIGAVGRIGTGGVGSDSPLALRGLNDREWTIEMGPTVGWRAWPVHMYVKSYFDLLGRHDGNVTEVQFMLPREFAWGWLIPGYELNLQDADFSNYYYGITLPESNVDRPVYVPGSTVNHELVLRYAYRLAERWLLTGSVRYEILDDAITGSPIVDRDALWSGSIGVAYDTDLFRPRDYPYPDHREPAVEIRVGAFFDNVDTEVTRRTVDNIPLPPVDIEDRLGLDDSGTLTQVDVYMRVARFHRLELSYFEFGRRGSITLDEDIDFGDLQIPAGTDVTTRAKTDVLRFSYSYSLMKDFQKELGITIGLHYTDTRVTLTTEDGDRERANGTTPLPVIGLNGMASFNENWMARAQVAGFWQDFDRFDGFLTSATFDVLRRIGDNFSVGAGINYYRLDISSDRESLRGDMLIEHFGPVVFVGASF